VSEWEGLEGSFAAFGLQGWIEMAANVPESEGKVIKVPLSKASTLCRGLCRGSSS